MAQLYSDEDFPFPVVEGLRDLGHDVVTALEAGHANQCIEDDEQLAIAIALGRAILTRNRKDFVRLHRLSVRHFGIVSITKDADFAGQATRIHQAIVDALAANSALNGLHLRVNRPNPSTPKE